MKKKNFSFHKTDKVDSLVELIERSQRLYSESVAIRFQKRKQGFEKTYNDVSQDSKAFGQFILNQKLTTGHVALLGASSYEWIISYIGIMYAGLTVVPLDKELESATLTEQILNADCDFLLYDKEYADVAQDILSSLGNDFGSFCINSTLPENEEVIPFPEIDPDKMSAILFTSGTTGKSKGVILTQRNIACDITCAVGAVSLNHEKDIALSVLPFNHAFESTCSIFGMIYLGIPVCLSRGLKYMQKEFALYQPTIMFIVPLIAEKLYEKIWTTAKKQGKDKMLEKGIKICHIARKLNIDLSDKLLSDVKSAFGGKLRILMCGGAPLSEDLIEKYADIGINLFQGYGLTECSPILTLNSDTYHRVNSVGKIIDVCEVKSVDGEIWARGTTISSGYYNNEIATAESFVDGWFKTGDLGYIDKDGFVFITGRKKNLIILSNGENVSAEELEAHLSEISYITEVIVFGKDGKIVAEIYIDPELVDNIPSREAIDEDIAKINKNLAYYKRIDEVIIRDEPFKKTTTKKIVRYNTNK